MHLIRLQSAKTHLYHQATNYAIMPFIPKGHFSLKRPQSVFKRLCEHWLF
ncbi:unknow [Vibrio campbellii]|nr:unknow [Vibrio campbellii]